MEGVVDDPVLARRARAGRLAEAGRRVGYSLLVVAVVAFGVGVARGFDRVVTTVVTVALACMSLVLGPAIVVGYGVRAADREDRERAGR